MRAPSTPGHPQDDSRLRFYTRSHIAEPDTSRTPRRRSLVSIPARRSKTSAIGAFAALLGLAALAGCGRESAVDADRADARLSVYRIEPSAGSAHASRIEAWQVVVIDGIDARHPLIGERGSEIQCEGTHQATCEAHAFTQAGRRGTTVLTGLGQLALGTPLSPGEHRPMSLGRTGFASALGGVVPPTSREPVHATVALVAHCPVRIERVESSGDLSIRADAIARAPVAISWLEARAECIGKDKIAFETPAPAAASQVAQAMAEQAAAARAEWDRRQAERDATRRADAVARDAFGEALLARAAAVPVTALPRADRDPATVEAWIPPRTEAAMRAARIVEVQFETRCAAFGNARGTSSRVFRHRSGYRPCRAIERVATVRYENGVSKVRGTTQGWPVDRMMSQIARVAIDKSDGRIRIDPPREPGPIGLPNEDGDMAAMFFAPPPADGPPRRVAGHLVALIDHLARWDGDGTQSWEAWLSPPALELP